MAVLSTQYTKIYYFREQNKKNNRQYLGNVQKQKQTQEIDKKISPLYQTKTTAILEI